MAASGCMHKAPYNPSMRSTSGHSSKSVHHDDVDVKLEHIQTGKTDAAM